MQGTRRSQLIAMCALWMLSLASAAQNDVQITVSPEGTLTDTVAITVVNLGDDWENIVSIDSPEESFASLRVQARSLSGNASLHPNKMRFVPRGAQVNAVIFALSLNIGVAGDTVLHDVTTPQGFTQVPLIPKAGGIFQVVYVVNKAVEEGDFYFEDQRVGTVRLHR